MAFGPFRIMRLVPLVLAAGLVLTACGSSSTGVPAPSVPAASSVASSDDAESIPGDDGSSGAGDTSDQNAMSPVDAMVRIVNTYVTLKGQKPTAIDVWAGTPASGGKKLVTVPYGTVSDYFAPLTQDPSQSQRFTLTFYPPAPPPTTRRSAITARPLRQA